MIESFCSDDEEIALYNESGLVDLEMYLNGNISLSHNELVRQCSNLIDQHALRVPIKGKVIGRADRFFSKATRSSTPFGPGCASFVLSNEGVVEALLLETDFGLFFAKGADPEHPALPMWDFWSLRNSADSLNSKEFVLISWPNLNEAIEIWLSTQLDGRVKLTKKSVSGFWEKDNFDDEDDHKRATWLSKSQKMSQLPRDARYLIDWLRDYLNSFEPDVNSQGYEGEAFALANLVEDVTELDPKGLAFLFGAHLGHIHFGL